MLDGSIHPLIDIGISRDRAAHQRSVVVAVQLIKEESWRTVEAIRIPVVLHFVPEEIGSVGEISIRISSKRGIFIAIEHNTYC